MVFSVVVGETASFVVLDMLVVEDDVEDVFIDVVVLTGVVPSVVVMDAVLLSVGTVEMDDVVLSVVFTVEVLSLDELLVSVVLGAAGLVLVLVGVTSVGISVVPVGLSVVVCVEGSGLPLGLKNSSLQSSN